MIYEILSYRLGLRRTLPADHNNKKPISENGSPLVRFQSTRIFVRAEIASMLRDAALRLPRGIKLNILEGWRSADAQRELWNNRIKQLKKEFPNKTRSDIERMAKAFVADPTSANGCTPHQTGAAVDLTLAKNGRQLDMGGAYLHFGKESFTNYRTLTKTQRENRDMLLRAMTAAGFQNYPGEWWHYSYGDRAWAAYKRKPYAIFGKIEG
jgi:D-alanyl-D-alanine dipeptidase